MAAPTNVSAVLATDIGTLPASITQTVDDAGTTYTVWYKYTATALESEINIFAFGDLTTYLADIQVYTGPDAAPVSYLGIGARNKPIQMPVTAGVTYYFRISPSAGNPTPAVLSLTGVTGPTATAPVGTIVVPDDTDGFPAAFVDSTTGDVLRFAQPFPAGEHGDVSADGHLLVNDDFTSELVWLDAQFNEISRLAFDADALVRINQSTDRFYVGNKGGGLTHAFITTVSNTGVLGGTTWTFAAAGLLAGCANPADTIFYYAPGGASGSAIKRWDLTNNVALSDLVATVANYTVCDMLGLNDGSILVLYYKSTVTRDAYVKQYSAAGATVATFNLGTNQSSVTPKLAYANDHPTTFWVMTHDASPSGYSVFKNIRVSDGTVLTTLTTPEFEGGAYQPAQTATPAADFGVSFSCPFFLTRVETPTAGTGTIRVVKVVVPITSSGTFNFTSGGGLVPSTFTLTGGDEQVFSSVPAGDGYSVVEDTPDGFIQLSVTVSNDSLPTNISVAADETVIVTVTNSQTMGLEFNGVEDPIRWLRRSPTVFHDGKRIVHRRFQVDFQPGVGLSSLTTDESHDPVVRVRTSDDGGFTWSGYRDVTLGAQGEYLKRMILRQLGSAYSRVYEISGNTPTYLCIVQAFLDIDGSDH